MPEVSIFANVASVKSPVQNIDLFEYLEMTRDGEWYSIVTECRAIKDQKERNKFKQTMPTTTLSGTFTYRDDNNLHEHSTFIAMDLDHVDNLEFVKQRLIKDKYVVSVFLSTSGDGLRVLFKIDPTKHREAFYGIAKYLLDTYEQPSDPNGVSLSKPYTVSFDPALYINPDVFHVPFFKQYVKETPIKQVPDCLHTTNDFEAVMAQIIGRGVNICEEYQDWLKIGFAFAEQFGENGRTYFHQVSQFSQKYKARTTDKQYDYCLKARGTTKAKISTFYYFAKLNNINIVTEQTKIIIRTTRNGKKAGLNKQQIAENLKKFQNIEGADKIVDEVFDAKSDAFSEDDSILYQLELFISNNYHFRMNTVTGYLEEGDRRLTESDLNSIFIAAKKMIPSLDYKLMMRLLKSDFIPTYNPFFEFFGSDGIPTKLPALPVRNDETKFPSPLIDKLAATIVNDDPAYTLYFVKKWMVGIVSAAHYVHSPLLLALLGKQQGTGKTEWFRRLLPGELQPYYAESKLDKEKDDELLMTENLIIMDDELGGKSKQDNNKLKNITSKQWFSLRRPYGDHNEKILRIAVLCGTSNLLEILSDPTGNRRIIPVEVQDIDKELYNSIDKKALLMEAYELYRAGYDWRITFEDSPYLNQDKERFETVIKERELIMKYFKPSDNADTLSTTEILVEIEILTKQRLSINSLGRELEKLGFIRKSVRDDDGKSAKKWFVLRINRSNLAQYD